MALLAAASPSPAHDRPTGPIHKTRSAVLARGGIAATSQPLAVQAAVRVLQEGGNAIDAAIAANAVIGVVEPMSCGIGGDLFAIVWDAESGTLHGLNASGRSPYRASIELMKEQGHEYVPVYGPLSWSVPGCVDGWATLHGRFGSVPMADLLAPAIRYAEEGFPVSEVIAAGWKADEPALAEIPSSAECYLPNGSAPGFGDVFRNPDLARTLRVIAEQGPGAFYRGDPASRIVAYSDEVGGLFSMKDFEDHESTWIDPVSTNYRGYDVWELPPNGQGIAALQMLNILGRYDLTSLGHNSAEALHLMIEAKKLAFEDRATYYADPEFADVPVAELISKDYADRRAALISPDRAMASVEPGDLAQSDTIYLTVVDEDRNCVSLIQSVFHSFGSHHVPRGLGFALQNRGSWFALDPGHANRLEPHKRPFHTIIPGFVTKDGAPWLSFGVMGGDMQPQGHVQVLCNMIDFGMDVQEAGEAPRFRHFGSSEPTGQGGDGGGYVSLESGIGPDVRRALEGKGHVIADRPGSYGGYQAIRIDSDRGVIMGGSDPRKDGAAIGY
ncbi:Putative gamma-glutamyltransferase YwrD [Tautonia plasticadhaerens]|uniref:Glutathione hydrolase proenzyme n=2 Tax=Tautonia plasticadhaerens TaxID=2527974 RepID=A0A518GZQ0_9BACT|nr:Putative gamma-glutamyltransferase YwrD [Tautonia plasticadhaerens]